MTLERARAGLYPESIESEVSAERLRRFFVKEDRGYRIQKSIRDFCVFARQNITVDPPFSHVDLVTCRNVLIYMSTALQERLLPLFHFALNPRGFLVLGMAETVGPHGDLFELVSRAHKIYRRKDSARRPQLTFLADEWLAGVGPRRSGPDAPPPDSPREADRVLLGTPRRRCSSTPTSRCNSFADARRRFSKPRPGSRRPAFCDWPGKACSWSCAVR
jgi:two-component system CheB/CheR fusion protein